MITKDVIFTIVLLVILILMLALFLRGGYMIISGAPTGEEEGKTFRGGLPSEEPPPGPPPNCFDNDGSCPSGCTIANDNDCTSEEPPPGEGATDKVVIGEGKSVVV